MSNGWQEGDRGIWERKDTNKLHIAAEPFMTDEERYRQNMFKPRNFWCARQELNL
jgi:hypothetical protein